MKQILRTPSVSIAESLRLALEAQGIACNLSNQSTVGIAQVVVSVINDDDFDRSLVVLRNQDTVRAAAGDVPLVIMRSWRWTLLAVLLALLAYVLWHR